MSRLVDTVSPPRLGVGFRWLLASSWISNLGDGVALAAGPLLVASHTGDAFLVALAALLQWLPQLLFGLYAGALSDRLDRRLIVVTVDVLRAIVLVVMAATILTGVVSIAVVLAALFLLGCGGVRGQLVADLAADAGAAPEPRPGQLSDPGRVHHRQPAGGTSARRGPLRRRHGLAIRRPGDLRRRGSAPR